MHKLNTLTAVRTGSGNLHLALKTTSLSHVSMPRVISEKIVICSFISVERVMSNLGA
jgi:hypothetical protein